MTDLRDPCWLCDDLGGVALHQAWTEKRGKPLWTAHQPVSASHPVRPCPACREQPELDRPTAEARRCFELDHEGRIDHWRKRAEEAERELAGLRAYHQQIGDLP